MLTHDHFPIREYNKFKEKKIEPCEIQQKINDNIDRLCLSSHLRTSNVFNVKHLTPCFVDSDEANVNLRKNSF